MLAYFGICLFEPTRKIFGLQVLPLVDYVILAGLAILRAVIMQLTWRYNLLDRFLKVNLKGPHKADWK